MDKAPPTSVLGRQRRAPTLGDIRERREVPVPAVELPQPADSVALRQQVNRLEELQARQSPWAQFEFVEVAFPSANVDVDIRHSLRPLTPEDVYWQVVALNAVAIIYKDATATRRAWDPNVIRLRSSTAGAAATLLLLVKR